MGVMARRPRKLTVTLSTAAHRSIDQIWQWNAEQYGRDHAQAYVDFLDKETAKLSTEYERGRPLSAVLGVQYLVIKRRTRGYGHILVYEVVGEVVHVIDYFHTAQDWERKLTGE